jgi:hypothetical protein
MASKINEKALSPQFLPIYRELKKKHPTKKLADRRQIYVTLVDLANKAEISYQKALGNFFLDCELYCEKIDQIKNIHAYLSYDDIFALEQLSIENTI